MCWRGRTSSAPARSPHIGQHVSTLLCCFWWLAPSRCHPPFPLLCPCVGGSLESPRILKARRYSLLTDSLWRPKWSRYSYEKIPESCRSSKNSLHPQHTEDTVTIREHSDHQTCVWLNRFMVWEWANPLETSHADVYRRCLVVPEGREWPGLSLPSIPFRTVQLEGSAQPCAVPHLMPYCPTSSTFMMPTCLRPPTTCPPRPARSTHAQFG